jgi:hypothetical protein
MKTPNESEQIPTYKSIFALHYTQDPPPDHDRAGFCFYCFPSYSTSQLNHHSMTIKLALVMHTNNHRLKVRAIELHHHHHHHHHRCVLYTFTYPSAVLERYKRYKRYIERYMTYVYVIFPRMCVVREKKEKKREKTNPIAGKSGSE